MDLGVKEWNFFISKYYIKLWRNLDNVLDYSI